MKVSKTQILSSELRQAFVRLIVKRTGLVIREQEQTALSPKIFSRMKAIKIAAPENYYQLLAGNSSQRDREWQNLVRLLTNNETYFFRDRGQFKVLRNNILPEIIQRNKKQKTIRICSAACSTGEEPYSLAIQLLELIPNLEEWNVIILGIDIDREALKTARSGVYSNWSFRNIDPVIKQKYFQSINPRYKLKHQIKKLVKFNYLNLVDDSFPQPYSELRNMDLIICRNLFIYFEPLAIAKVLDKFYHTLEPLGYLITGHGELFGQKLTPRFHIKELTNTIIYQRSEKKYFETTETRAPKINNIFPLTSNQKKREPPQEQDVQFKTINNFEPPNYVAKNTTKQQPKLNILAEAEKLFQQKKYNLAIQQVNKLLRVDSQNFDAYYLMAQIQANIAKYEEAIYYCDRALEMDSFSVEPYYLLAKIAEERGNISEAKRIFKRIIYLEPFELQAYLDLVEIYQQEGDRKRKSKMQQAALNILKKMPPNTKIKSQNNVTAAELISKL